jgi:hypothetical protein
LVVLTRGVNALLAAEANGNTRDPAWDAVTRFSCALDAADATDDGMEVEHIRRCFGISLQMMQRLNAHSRDMAMRLMEAAPPNVMSAEEAREYLGSMGEDEATEHW